MRRPQKAGKKASKLFQPVRLSYEEDKLRWEYFNDHPWELARPRIVLEDDGKDGEKWDWGVELDVGLRRPGSEVNQITEVWEPVWRSQAGRPLNGESVVQRQSWLLRNTNQSPAAAYDKARKELYRARHALEIERRVAKEEALATGAFFGAGPLEIGMQLENDAYEDWKAWAIKETAALKQLQGASYTGNEAEDTAENGPAEGGEDSAPETLQVKEVADAVPGGKRGQQAMGGQAIHP